MIDWQAIRQRWEADGSKRDERGRRLFAASEARAAGWGGLAAVSSVTGLARSTIGRGLKDLDAPPLAPGQVRREGGGPRSLSETDATLLDDLKRLVEPATLGDPARPLLWVSKVSTSWPLRLSPWATRSAPTACASCSSRSVSHGRSTGKRTRALATPPVLPHHAELARPAAHRPRYHHRTHHGDNHQDRAQS